MTVDGMAERIAAAIRSFFAEHEVATLKLPSGWFGRPNDNWHQLTEVSVTGPLVQVRLDETQQLELAASAVAVDGRILRIAIDRGGWTWISYGASERHQEALNAGTLSSMRPITSSPICGIMCVVSSGTAPTSIWAGVTLAEPGATNSSHRQRAVIGVR